MKENESSSMVSSMMHADADALKVRLDTTQLMQQIDCFLQGKTPITTINEVGEIVTELRDTGKPFCNDEGRQKIMNWVTGLVNPTTLQGNKSREEMNALISDFYEQFTDDVNLNLYKWEVDEDCMQLLINGLMGMIEMALSRTIDNQERKLFAYIKEGLSSRRVESKGLFLGGSA